MKKYLTSIILCLLFTTATVYAQDVFNDELFSADVVLKYRTDIKLSDSQADKIKDIYNGRITEFNSVRWDLDAAVNDLENLLSTAQIDRTAAKKQMEKVMVMEDRLKMIRLEMLVDIKNELNGKQQSMLKELRTDTDLEGHGFITPINEDPRMVLKIEGKDFVGEPLIMVIKGDEWEQVTSAAVVDPNDIESVEVIKGDKAWKEYGAKGKNGVILITLKSDKK